jgi:hypothetical protein
VILTVRDTIAAVDCDTPKNRPQSPTRVIERGDDLGLLRSPPFGAHRFLSFYRSSSVGTLLAFRSEVDSELIMSSAAEQLRLMPVQPSSFALCLLMMLWCKS